MRFWRCECFRPRFTARKRLCHVLSGAARHQRTTMLVMLTAATVALLQVQLLASAADSQAPGERLVDGPTVPAKRTFSGPDPKPERSEPRHELHATARTGVAPVEQGDNQVQQSQAPGVEMQELGCDNCLILSVDRLGLGNRLRLLASSWILAAELKRELVVDWRPATGCSAHLADLFESVPFKEMPEYLPRPAKDLILSKLAADNETKGTLQNGRRVEVFQLQNAYLVELDSFRSIAEMIIVTGNGMFQPVGMDCREYAARKRWFYRSLVPRREVRELVDTVESQFYGNHLVIGVHVRKYDEQFDWPVVPPQGPPKPTGTTKDGDAAVAEVDGDAEGDDGELERAQTFEEVAPIYVFRQVIDDLLRRHPNARIFLASNSMKVKLAFQSLFGDDRMLSLNVSLARKTTTGLQGALTDWILLSDTSLIILPYGSSFAQEAAARHGIPSIRVQKAGHLWGTDPSKPHCNDVMLENALQLRVRQARQRRFEQARLATATGDTVEDDKEHSPEEEEPIDISCYTDYSRPAGEEVSCSVKLKKSLCKDAIASWGVPRVYC